MSDKSKINLKSAWRENADKLRKVGIKTPLLDARLLLQHVLKITYEDLLTQATRELTDKEVSEYSKLMSRRLKREPVSKILGEKEFWSRDFKVTKDTLDPRPDSETIIQEVLKNFKDKDRELKILDLGTGSGCLLITLLKEYKNATGVGVDISVKALKVSAENAETHKVDERAEFLKSDWLKNVNGRFDIVISNPPYIKREAIDYLPAEVRLYDPKVALDGGKDGLDVYRKLIPQIGNHLNMHGKCFLEIGKWQESLVEDVINENKYEINNIRQDLLGIPRVIVFNKPYLKVVKG